MITYQEEPLKDCLEEMKPLLEQHWKEIALHQDKIKLNPDYEQYLRLDCIGMLSTVTARDDGKLIGYFVTFIPPNLHYKDNVIALNDILFLNKDYRGGTVAYKMFKFAINVLVELGVDVIQVHEKKEHSFKPLMDRLGFEHIENIYSRYVGGM